MKNRTLILLLVVFILFSGYTGSHAQIQSPKQYLGFPVGADRKLADWTQISGYFRHLDTNSDRLSVENIGKTVLGRDMLAVFISDSDNLRKLKKLQNWQKEIATGRKSDDLVSRRMIDEGVAVVLINCAIHSTEIGSSQLSMELAYELCTKKNENASEILKNTLLILIPSANPDGIDIVSDWYRKSIGTKWEGSGPPELYHHYAGHDNNRDWYMLMLPETRHLAKVLYQDWFPEIVYDMHQMGRNGPRMFTPPFYYITNPNIDPLILRSLMLIGGHITNDLTAAGKSGVATGYSFDTWWHGGFRTAPYFHNMIGILTETASAKIATPVNIPFSSLHGSRRGLPSIQTASANFPDPWKGGTWRLWDIINYEKNVSYTLLTLASRYKDMFIKNMYIMGRKNIETGKTENPFAYIFPPDQRDTGNLRELMDILKFQGTEIHVAKKSFSSEGKTFPAGTFIIYLSQPFRTNVKTLLEKQVFTGKKTMPDGPMESPYDATGWTLPFLMDVNYLEIHEKFTAETKILKTINEKKKPDVSGKFIIIDPGQNRKYQFINELFANNVGMSLMNRSGGSVPQGSVIIRANKTTKKFLSGFLEKYPLKYTTTNNIDLSGLPKLKQPRTAVYQGYIPNMDEGWTRRMLDEFSFRYSSLHDPEIRAGNLNEKYDVIIFASQNTKSIINGRKNGTYPEQFTGGIGTRGVENLRQFIESGGTLITFNSSCGLPMEYFHLPVKDELNGIRSNDFLAPGAIVMGIAKNSHPITWGYNREIPLYFAYGKAFSVSEGSSPVRYAENNVLLSGYIHKPEKLAGKSALADIPLAKGRCILFGFRPQNRAQTWGTFLMILNSIYYSVNK